MLPASGPQPRMRRGQRGVCRDGHYAWSCRGSHRAHLSLTVRTVPSVTCGLTVASPLIKGGLQAGSHLWVKEFTQVGMAGGDQAGGSLRIPVMPTPMVLAPTPSDSLKLNSRGL